MYCTCTYRLPTVCRRGIERLVKQRRSDPTPMCNQGLCGRAAGLSLAGQFRGKSFGPFQLDRESVSPTLPVTEEVY